MESRLLVDIGLGAYEIDDLLDEPECAFLTDLIEQYARGDWGEPRSIQTMIVRHDETVVAALQRCEQVHSITLTDLLQRVCDRLRKALPALCADTVLLERDNDSVQARFRELGNLLTISRHPGPHRGLSLHRDLCYSEDLTSNDLCPCKLAINLSHTPIGTAFYADGNRKKQALLAQSSGKRGSAVLFDLKAWHSGTAVVANECKLMLGVRLLFEPVNGDGSEVDEAETADCSNL